MLVNWSWPGKTRVLSGSCDSFASEERMSSSEPSGKSVRPQEQRNRTSPHIRTGSLPQSSL